MEFSVSNEVADTSNVNQSRMEVSHVRSNTTNV